MALPLLRLTSTYHAVVSTVAADAALGVSATAAPATSTVASTGLSADAHRPRRKRVPRRRGTWSIESTVILLDNSPMRHCRCRAPTDLPLSQLVSENTHLC